MTPKEKKYCCYCGTDIAPTRHHLFPTEIRLREGSTRAKHYSCVTLCWEHHNLLHILKTNQELFDSCHTPSRVVESLNDYYGFQNTVFIPKELKIVAPSGIKISQVQNTTGINKKAKGRIKREGRIISCEIKIKPIVEVYISNKMPNDISHKNNYGYTGEKINYRYTDISTAVRI